MELDYKIIIAAIAVIVIIAIAFNAAPPVETTQNNASILLREKQEITNPPLTLEYWPEGSVERLVITAAEDASFNLYTVVPFDRASSYSDYEIDNSPPSPAESIFAEDALATRDALSLAANETKNKTLSFDSNGSAPLYLVTQPGAAAKEADAFKALLKEVASLSLSRSESSALQGRLNEFLAPQEEFTAEFIEAVSEAVEEVKQAKIINPDYNATKQIEELKLPAYPALNGTESPLDALPESINLTVSELDPIATTEVSFALQMESQVLTRMEGDLKEYVEGLEFERLGSEYFSWFSVNLEDAPRDSDELFRKDDYNGILYIGVNALVEERAISVTVKVEHSRKEDLAKLEEVEEELEEAEEPEEIEENGIVSQSLAGKKVFVGIGHHGKRGDGCDLGAGCSECGTVCPSEYERNKAVSEKLAEWLESAGAQVYLFDANCEITSPTASYRANAADAWGADLLVEIHHDQCGSGKQMVFYDGAASERRKSASIAIAERVNSKLTPLVDKSVGVKADDSGYSWKDNLGVLSTDMPSILVEVTRVDDPGYAEPGFKDELAKAIFEGIASYYGYSNIQQGAYRASFACSKSITETPQIFSSCEKYEEELKSAMQRNGLYPRGFDLGLVEALIMQESSCIHERDNDQGLMQVVSCGNQGGCTVEENIERGTEELAMDFDHVKAGLPDASQAEQIKMMLFGYNRGTGTVDLAIQKMSGGATLEDAMREACYEKYEENAYYSSLSGTSCSGYDKESCCNGEGLGARYPEKVLERYESACESAGGIFTWE